MFAVPGWNLAAKSPVLGKEKGSDGSDSVSTTKPTPSQNGKRKRGRETNGQVDPEDLDKLWSKQFGNGIIDGGAIKARKEKKNKKQRIVEDGGKRMADVAAKAPAKRDNTHENTTGESQVKKKRKNEDLKPKGVTNDTSNQLRTEKKSNRQDSKEQHGKQSAGNNQYTTEKQKPKLPVFAPPPPPPPPKAALTPLQQSMRAKLISARFRHLNEALYTTDSSKALSMFSESPELFSEYHAGFSQQVKESWPENPVDIYIANLKDRGKIPFKLGKDGRPSQLSQTSLGSLPLPRRPHGTCTIADLGCGDAPLARGLQSSVKKLNFKFHNFDLHAANSLITKADISSLPLKDGEIDIAVFCLSLMGTNWLSFVEEAWRILRGDGRGEVWVAEVKSRFGRVVPQRTKIGDEKPKKKPKKKQPKRDRDSGDESAGEEVFAEIDNPSYEPKPQDETNITGFVEVFQRRGFVLRPDSVNKSNKMFVSMIFTKSGVPTAGKWKGMKWVGTHYERMSQQQQYGKKKFLDQASTDKEISADEERNVLKPCVYKIR
ncbi:putative rrna processing protein [Phaeomoniella chlamydospora]|uniref:Ribosomal RNA-processing protein 8 n=1 Tax=Phaeomoniella chlamydospora TaxID=158046 RepID=A0A0G2EGH1_PHACM|nr:putative rrna processing protein [Phaeomoniella chlamydospora]